MKEITLLSGKVALVDDEDYEYVNRFRWREQKAKNSSYAVSYVRGSGATIFMHRLIMLIAERCLVVDHIDGNGLNNCKSNLRVCTQQQNTWNAKQKRKGMSKYRGVYFQKTMGKWTAILSIEKKKTWLGYFDNEIDAAKAYNEAVIKHRGEFAVLNIID